MAGRNHFFRKKNSGCQYMGCSDVIEMRTEHNNISGMPPCCRATQTLWISINGRSTLFRASNQSLSFRPKSEGEASSERLHSVKFR